MMRPRILNNEGKKMKKERNEGMKSEKIKRNH